MATLKDEAMSYQPPKKENISDLKRIPVNMELLTGSGQDRDTGKSYTYKYILMDGKEYKVPGPVLGQLKEVMAKFPEAKYFSVMRTGEGKNSKYSVIPLADQ